MSLKVFSECCKNCLLSESRIVSPARVKDIINDCKKKQTHFICHKATMKGEEIVCKKYYEIFGHTSQLIRIAERLNVVEFVEQDDNEALITHKEMIKNKKKSPIN